MGEERQEFRALVRDRLFRRAADLERIGTSPHLTHYLLDLAVALDNGQPLVVGVLSTLAVDLVALCTQDARITPEQAQDWLETER